MKTSRCKINFILVRKETEDELDTRMLQNIAKRGTTRFIWLVCGLEGIATAELRMRITYRIILHYN